MKRRIYTIGAYGFQGRDFFSALQEAGVDTFCDLRSRRGVRGAEYAFVNSRRLQARLKELDIRYLHRKDLAPSKRLRDRQTAADRVSRVSKRRRAELSNDFVAGYETECLEHFDSRTFIKELGENARVVVLFCVERAPSACHRSLIAGRLERDLGVKIVHLEPN